LHSSWDVSVEKDVEDMIGAVVAHMGRLDVVSSISILRFILVAYSHMQMVANAGICITKPILESMLCPEELYKYLHE
jgi:hypothetical protein